MNTHEKPQRPGWGRNLTPGSVNSNFQCTRKNRQRQPVFNESGKPIASVSDGELVKQVRAEHFLRKPPAIAFDLVAIQQAQQLGANRIRVIDRLNGIVYRVSMAIFIEKAFSFDRGFGAQMGLTLPHWTVSRPDESTATQLRLF